MTWVNPGRLPHLLPPSAYSGEARERLEIERLFAPGWHFAATLGELEEGPRSLDLFGAGVRLSLGPSGPRASPAGRRRGPGLDPDHCRAESLGQLVFVSLSAHGPSLREHLGEVTWALGERAFARGLREVVRRRLDHGCNWKIPLENVLESYHVPSLHRNALARHPELFEVFTGRQGGGPAHELGDRYTSYHDSLGARSRLYRALIERVRPGASPAYVHHHAFPDLIVAHTSIVSFLQVVRPASPSSCTSDVRIFLDLGEDGRLPLGRALAPLLRRASARLIDMVIAEDAAVYEDVQRGMEASPHPGVLGSREERIHRFHAWLAEACS